MVFTLKFICSQHSQCHLGAMFADSTVQEKKEQLHPEILPVISLTGKAELQLAVWR